MADLSGGPVMTQARKGARNMAWIDQNNPYRRRLAGAVQGMNNQPPGATIGQTLNGALGGYANAMAQERGQEQGQQQRLDALLQRLQGGANTAAAGMTPAVASGSPQSLLPDNTAAGMTPPGAGSGAGMGPPGAGGMMLPQIGGAGSMGPAGGGMPPTGASSGAMANNGMGPTGVPLPPSPPSAAGPNMGGMRPMPGDPSAEIARGMATNPGAARTYAQAGNALPGMPGAGASMGGMAPPGAGGMSPPGMSGAGGMAAMPAGLDPQQLRRLSIGLGF